jgi:hypothetical protein
MEEKLADQGHGGVVGVEWSLTRQGGQGQRHHGAGRGGYFKQREREKRSGLIASLCIEEGRIKYIHVLTFYSFFFFFFMWQVGHFA